MKKSLIYSLILGTLLLVTASFAPGDGKPVKKATAKKAIVANPTKFTCVADITYGSITVSFSGSTATVSFGYTGSPASFNYGGYYNGGSGTINGNVVAPNHSVNIPIPAGTTSFRIGFLCKCSDGTLVGSTHGALIYLNGTMSQF